MEENREKCDLGICLCFILDKLNSHFIDEGQTHDMRML